MKFEEPLNLRAHKCFWSAPQVLDGGHGSMTLTFALTLQVLFDNSE